jgi:hypothetical protein
MHRPHPDVPYALRGFRFGDPNEMSYLWGRAHACYRSPEPTCPSRGRAVAAPLSATRARRAAAGCHVTLGSAASRRINLEAIAVGAASDWTALFRYYRWEDLFDQLRGGHVIGVTYRHAQGDWPAPPGGVAGYIIFGMPAHRRTSGT